MGEMLSKPDIHALGPERRRRIILVNPSHGNEPYILGAQIAVRVGMLLAERGVADIKVVIPYLYPEGERQKKILQEVTGTQRGSVYLDRRLGESLRKILFGDNNFPDHLRRTVLHAQEVEEEIRSHFANTFHAENIESGQKESFDPHDIIASIDTSPRVSLPAPFRASAFPALLPEVLRRSREEGLDFGISEDEWGRIMQQVEKIENGNTIRFLPRFHTFAHDALGEKRILSPDETYDLLMLDASVRHGWDVVYTPPMKTPAKEAQSEELDNDDGIFAVYSGTASGLEEVRDAAQATGLHVYDNKTVLKDATRLIADNRIRVVISRAGQGTGWQVYLAAKPWVVTPYRLPDDPELYFDNKMIEGVGLGVVLEDTDKNHVEEAIGKAEAMVPRLQTLRRRQLQEFGTLDGIEFMAQKIAAELLRMRDEGRLPL